MTANELFWMLKSEREEIKKVLKSLAANIKTHNHEGDNNNQQYIPLSTLLVREVK